MLCATCRGSLESVMVEKELSCSFQDLTMMVPAFRCPHCNTTWISDDIWQSLSRLCSEEVIDPFDIHRLLEYADSNDSEPLFNLGLL